MKFDPKLHHRQSTRLKEYDYSQNGMYFITICVQDKKCLFGEVLNEEMVLSSAGKMIESEFGNLQERYINLELDELVVMPNHLHGIISIVEPELVGVPLVGTQTVDKPHTQGNSCSHLLSSSCKERAGTRPAPTRLTFGNIIGAFKSITTNKYIEGVGNNNWPIFEGKLWQRNYYEHIIRNEKSLNQIRDYIINNPRNWKTDEMFVL